MTSGVNPGIAAADLNGDGYADILAGTNTSLAISMNNGDGTFATEVKYGNLNREDVQVGDLDKDGDLDAFYVTNTSVANGGPGVYIALNNGDGTFVVSTFITTTANGTPLMVAVNDFDGDTELDLAVVNQDLNNMSVFISRVGEQWNINPEGERDLAYLNVKDSNNTNPVFIAAYNAPGVVNLGNNTGWYFTAPTVGVPVSYGSTVTGGSGSSPLSMPDSLITTTPEGLKVSEYDTKVKTVSKNEVTPPQYTFTENSYAEVGGTNVPVDTEIVENTETVNESISTTTTFEVDEKFETTVSKNSVVKKVGWLACIVLIIGFLMRRFFRRFA